MTKGRAPFISESVTDDLQSVDFKKRFDWDIMIRVMGQFVTGNNKQEELAHVLDSLSFCGKLFYRK